MEEAFYFGLANELAAKVGRVSSFVSHGPSIGAYHEEVLKAVLRPMLPERFSLRRGFVFHPERGCSQQGDILIVDEMQPGGYFFREGDFVVISEEALACVIEVKTRLTKTSFRDGVKGLYSFQRVTGQPNHPVTLLFSYESASFTPKRLDDWYKSVDLPDELLSYPFAVYGLNRGLLSLRKPSDQEWGHYIVTGEKSQGLKLKTLSVFLQTVRKAVLVKGRVEANPFELAVFEGLSWSQQYMRFGTGLHELAATQQGAPEVAGLPQLAAGA